MITLMVCLTPMFGQYDRLILKSGDTLIGSISSISEDGRIHFITKDGQKMVVIKDHISKQDFIPFVNSDKVKYKNQTEQYCEITVWTFVGLDKPKISVDYGNSRWKDINEKSDDGNILKFETVIDALNYMNSKGWTFVNAYVVQNVYHYIMKRRIDT